MIPLPGSWGHQGSHCLALQSVGKPIDQPLIAEAQLILEPDALLKDVHDSVDADIDRELENIQSFTHRLAKGELSMPMCFYLPEARNFWIFYDKNENIILICINMLPWFANLVPDLTLAPFEARNISISSGVLNGDIEPNL